MSARSVNASFQHVLQNYMTGAITLKDIIGNALAVHFVIASRVAGHSYLINFRPTLPFGSRLHANEYRTGNLDAPAGNQSIIPGLLYSTQIPQEIKVRDRVQSQNR